MWGRSLIIFLFLECLWPRLNIWSLSCLRLSLFKYGIFWLFKRVTTSVTMNTLARFPSIGWKDSISRYTPITLLNCRPISRQLASSWQFSSFNLPSSSWSCSVIDSSNNCEKAHFKSPRNCRTSTRRPKQEEQRLTAVRFVLRVFRRVAVWKS